VAATAQDPIDFWRFSKLAEGVCDLRIVALFWDIAVGVFFRHHGADVLERLIKVAEQRAKKRSGILFGLKAARKKYCDDDTRSP
jgi:hypothetical protein